mmetsp:Transcript_62167/g.189848  ORF Transcript_62167/g.189848 Transcript_62167/m.189848 type:complete len:212 (+) Transcript_62167:501-1136(+)
MSDGMWNSVNTLAKQDTTPVPRSLTELMYSSRKVCDSEKSSPKNSPTCVRSTLFSDKKLLSSTGKSRTALVDTKNAKPWPGRLLKISTPMRWSDLMSLTSMPLSTEARGTKNGSNLNFEEIWMSSTASASKPMSHVRPKPWSWRCAAHKLSASRSHTSLHRSDGARPFEFRCARSAPFRISSMATLRRPMKSATCSAVQPAMSVASSGKSW